MFDGLTGLGLLLTLSAWICWFFAVYSLHLAIVCIFVKPTTSFGKIFRISVPPLPFVAAGLGALLWFASPPRIEFCDDGVDNNGNGIVDCDEGTCTGGEYCTAIREMEEAKAARAEALRQAAEERRAAKEAENAEAEETE
jgi:hypothetical protein